METIQKRIFTAHIIGKTTGPSINTGLNEFKKQVNLVILNRLG